MSTKVLIIDDEPDVARYLATILRANGYEASVANDARSGLVLACEGKPNLVCLDIMMPRESGISMYQKLRENIETASIPVLLISGAEQQEKFDFRSYLPDESIPEPEGYLEKPVDIEKFLETVRQLTNQSGGRG